VAMKKLMLICKKMRKKNYEAIYKVHGQHSM
jgi:hypothetical protein